MNISRTSWHFRVYERWSHRKYKKGYDERADLVKRSREYAEKCKADAKTAPNHATSVYNSVARDAVNRYLDALDTYGRPSLNLCPYMRTIMFYAPFRWFFQGYASNGIEDIQDLLKVPVFWTVVSAIASAIIWITASHPLLVGGIVLGAVLGLGFVVGLLIGIVKLVDYYKHKKALALSELASNPPPPKPIVVPEMEKEQGLFKSWLHAKHQKVCPVLKVKD